MQQLSTAVQAPIHDIQTCGLSPYVKHLHGKGGGRCYCCRLHTCCRQANGRDKKSHDGDSPMIFSSEENSVSSVGVWRWASLVNTCRLPDGGAVSCLLYPRRCTAVVHVVPPRYGPSRNLIRHRTLSHPQKTMHPRTLQSAGLLYAVGSEFGVAGGVTHSQVQRLARHELHSGCSILDAMEHHM